MSIELVKQWQDNPDSVTAEQIDEALESMKLLLPTGANQCLFGALSSIKTGSHSNVAVLVQRYEKQTA